MNTYCTCGCPNCAAAIARLESEAKYCDLTGLLRRQAAVTALRAASPQDEEFKLTVVYIDLDFFKTVNDTRGHSAGDEVLVKVARVLLTSVRDTDIVSRLGGEEFAIILRNVPDSLKTAESIRKRIASIRFRSKALADLKITASIGVSDMVLRREDLDGQLPVLIEQADQALYRAKAEGRNRVVHAAQLLPHAA